MEVKKINRNGQTFYERVCPVCASKISYKRFDTAYRYTLSVSPCRACNNSIKGADYRLWVGHIRLAWYNNFKSRALKRKLAWEIDPQFISDMLERQQFKCALSGLELVVPADGHSYRGNLSIDRIDSKKGYTKDNVQLVLGRVNMMKGIYDQEEFIRLAEAIVKHNKEKTYGKRSTISKSRS
jgi:hypothetical protein